MKDENVRAKDKSPRGIRNREDRASLHTAYFYYFRYAPDGTYGITAYELFDISDPLGKVEDVAKKLVDNARDPNGRDPRPYGTDFDALFRRRKGYFIIALEGAAFKSDDPVTFTIDGATHTTSKGNPGKHTFMPVGRHDVTLPTNEVISVVAYGYRARSFHKGVELDHGEWEHFTIQFDAAVRNKLVRNLFEDSGGTNMGPPPPPPVRSHRRRPT